MANDNISRKDLYLRLGNVRHKDWIRIAPKLNLNLVKSKSSGSHYINLRDPKFPEEDIKGLVTTITPNCFKEANQQIFKKILAFCKRTNQSEDDIWRELGML